MIVMTRELKEGMKRKRKKKGEEEDRGGRTTKGKDKVLSGQ